MFFMCAILKNEPRKREVSGALPSHGFLFETLLLALQRSCAVVVERKEETIVPVGAISQLPRWHHTCVTRIARRDFVKSKRPGVVSGRRASF